MNPRTDIVQVAALLVAARTVVADPARWCAWPHALDANGHRCEGRANNAVCWGGLGALDRVAADAGASHRIFLEARWKLNQASVPVAGSWTGTAWVLDYDAAHSMTVAIFDEAIRAMPRPKTPGALDILTIARTLIARPDRWAQGAIALDRKGRALSSFDGSCRFCAAGAVGLAAHVLGGDEASQRCMGPAVDRAGRLTEDRVPAGAALARYVGVDAYGAAGGPVLRDLFADEHENGVWLEDPALLIKLALGRLQVAADELATRWKWAEARLDVNWSDLARFGRVHPTPAEPTDEEKAQIEKLHVRHDELVNLDEDEWTDELIEEAEAIEPRLAEIQDAIKARAVYKPEDIAIAGCIATVGDDGTIQVVHGLVKPEDMPAKDAGAAQTPGAAGAAGTHDDGAGIHVPGTSVPSASGPAMPPARPDPETEARKEAGVGIGLADDLRAIRTTLVKAHLAEDFGAAFDLMLFQMGRAVFTPGYHDHALDITVRETPDRPPLRANDDTFHESSPGEEMLADRSLLRFDWLEIEDRAESFAALRALAPKDKKRLFAACVARTLNGQLAFEANARPETEATVARLDIEFAEHVRPGAEMFWSRVRKDRVMDVARRTLGIEWAHTHRKDKKAALATAMETTFAAGDAVPLGVSKEGRSAALAWVPPGFAAFDTGRIDDGDAAGPQAEAPPAGQPTPDASASDEPQSGTQPEAPAGQPKPAADAPEVQPPDTGDAERPAPSEASDGTPDPETTGSPGVSGPSVPDAATVAPTVVKPIDAMNTVPVAGGGPRVIVNTVGIDADDGTEASPEIEPSPPPVPGNGHDAGGDALDIPAFLRR